MHLLSPARTLSAQPDDRIRRIHLQSAGLAEDSSILMQ